MLEKIYYCNKINNILLQNIVVNIITQKKSNIHIPLTRRSQNACKERPTHPPSHRTPSASLLVHAPGRHCDTATSTPCT